MSSFKEQLIEILDRVCGETYDLIEESPHTRTNVFRLTIHYPEFTISNSKNYSRVIKDMYVSLEIGEHKLLSSLQGFRMTYTMDEFRVGYTHSHLRTKSFVGYLSNVYNHATEKVYFCLGHSELAMLMIDLKMKMDLFKFEMLLFFIPQFLQWESLEGGPHYRMMNINSNNNNHFTMNHNQYSQAKDYIIRNLYDLPLKIEVSNNIPRLCIDQYNIDAYNVLKENWPIKAYTTGNGVYYSTPPIPPADEYENWKAQIHQENTFTFRGQVVPFKLLPSTIVQEEEYYLEAPPSCIAMTLQDLNLLFEQYLIYNEILK